MYKTFFNLQIKPFETTPDPKFLWLGEKYAEALSVMRYGILENKGFLLLTGDAGTGKTTLINALKEGFDATVQWALVSDPNRERLDFYNAIAKGFGIAKEFTSKVQFLIEFSNFLHRAHDDQKKMLLLIDDCHRLSQEMLEELRLLSNIEKEDTKLINIFFVGRRDFHEMLALPKNRAIRQRLALMVDLPPLTVVETEAYVRHRLKVAGSEGKVFSSKALQAVFRYSHGIPKNINTICHQALMAASIIGKRSIDNKMVEECLGKVNPAPEGNRERREGATSAKRSPAQRRSASSGFAELQEIISAKGSEANGVWAWLKYGLGGVALVVMVVTLWHQADKFPGDTKTAVNKTVQVAPVQEAPSAKRAPVVTVIEQPRNVINDKKAEELRNAILERAYGDRQDGRQAPIRGVAAEDAKVAAGVKVHTQSQEDPGAVAGQQVPAALATVKTVADEAQSNIPEMTKDVAVLQPAFSAESKRSQLPTKIVLPLAPNSVQLTVEATGQLHRFVKELDQHPEVRLLVKGYVSSDSVSAENDKLSEDRARMVEKLLLAGGVAGERIEVKGMGIEEPLASNATSDGRTKNRRVEIVVLEDER